jgi:hypothetical protein
MAPSSAAIADDRPRATGFPDADSNSRRSLASAVSWSAIVAGAAAAAALSLILLILGVGLGMSSVSPWSGDGISAATFGLSTILWLTLTQLLASAMGGYLAGRLRTRWTDAHADEVYFRDTAHGFLAWAVASLATATLLTSVIGSIVSGGVQAGASVMDGVASTARSAVGAASDPARSARGGEGGPMAYFVDSLFRPDAAAAPEAGSAPDNGGAITRRVSADDVAEIGRIFMNFSLSGPLPPADIRYVGQVVAQRTGLPQQAAEQRVTDVYARAQAQLRDAEETARAAADQARQASAYSALWLFVSLLVGAFVASLAATFGGRQRDA